MSEKQELEVDRGWFSADPPVGHGPDSMPLQPADARGSNLSDAQWNRIIDLLNAYERDIAAAVDPRRRAVLSYEVGRIYETRLGDDRRAVAAYQRAHRCDPFHLPILHAGRAVFARAGRWPMVLRLLDAELRAEHSALQRATLLVAKGDIYSRCDDAPSAQACYSAALDLSPGDRAAARALSQLAAADRDVSGLADCLERQAGQCGDRQFQLRLLVDAASSRLAKNALDERAVQLLEVARAAAPDDPAVLDLLARAHRRAGRWEALIALWSSAPHAFEASMSKAERLTEIARLAVDRLGELSRGVDLVVQALAIDPWCAAALELQADVLERAGKPAAAVASLERLVGVTRDPVVRIRLFTHIAELRLRHLDDEDGAITALQRVLEVSPAWGPALESLGRLFAQRGDWGRTLAMYEGELPLESNPRARANLRYRMGELSEHRLLDRPLAASHYRLALEASPGFAAAADALLRVLRAGSDVDALCAALAEAARLAIDSDEKLSHLEELAELQSSHPSLRVDALSTWREVMTLRPDHGAARRGVLRLCEALSRPLELLAALESEGERTRDEGRLLALLVRCAEVAERLLSDRARARAYLDRALSTNPRHLPALQAAGRLCQATSDYSGLVEMHRRELELSREPAEAVALYYKIGTLQREHLGDPLAAIVSFEAVVDLESNHLPAIRALASLFSDLGDVAREAEMLAAEVECLTEPIERLRLLCRLGALYQHRTGQLDLAVEAYETALRVFPNTELALMPLIALHEERDDAHELAATLRRLAASRGDTPSAADAWVQVARVCADCLHLEIEAIEAAERALELTLDTPNVGALLLLERLYRAHQAPHALARVCGLLASAVHTREDALAYRVTEARVRDGFLDDPLEADRAWVRVLEWAPSHREALDRLEAIRLVSGDREGLLSVLSRRASVATDARERAGTLNRLADLQYEMGRLADAASTWEAVIELDPSSLPAAHDLRIAYTELGRGDDALRLTETEAQLTASSEAAAELFLVAARIRETGLMDLEGAFLAFAAALQRLPESEEAAEGVRRVGERLGRHVEVVRLLELRATALPEQCIEIMMEVSRLYASRLRAPDQAVRALNLALIQMPTQSVPVLQRLADLYAEQEAWTEAAAIYEQLRAAASDAELRRAVAFRLAALYEDKLLEPARARACLEAAQVEFPDDPELHGRLARLYESSGQSEAAVASLRTALSLSVDGAFRNELGARLGIIFERRGQSEAALELFNTVLAADPDNAEIALRAAQLHAGRGESDTVVALLGTVLQASSRQPSREADSIRRRAAALLLDHDAEQGRSELRKLVAAQPEDVDARSLLARALATIAGAEEEAAAHLIVLFERDPFDVANVRRLLEVWARAGRMARAHQLAHLLRCLGHDDDLVRDCLEGCSCRDLNLRRGALSESFCAMLRSPLEVPGLDDLLKVLVAALPSLFSSPPLVPARDVDTAELKLAARQIGAVFSQSDVRVLVDRTLGDGVRYTDASPALLVFGPAAVRAGDRSAWAFHLGRGIELGRRGLASALCWEPRAIKSLLEAAADFGSGAAPTGEPRSSGRTQLDALLDGRGRRVVQDMAPEARQALVGLDLEAAFEAFRESVGRIGLLVAGDISGVVASGAPGRLTELPGARALLRFLVDDRYYAARETLGRGPG